MFSQVVQQVVMVSMKASLGSQVTTINYENKFKMKKILQTSRHPPSSLFDEHE
jgi:hypothetical protein